VGKLYQLRWHPTAADETVRWDLLADGCIKLAGVPLSLAVADLRRHSRPGDRYQEIASDGAPIRGIAEHTGRSP
jgi:hypothetical protein